jgi:GNAT superfamily N-acetyltransferase
MSGPPPVPYRLTNGYLIRKATCADVPAIARVHVDSFRTTYPGILPASFLDGLSYERREESWRRDLCEPQQVEYAYVAVDPGGQVVGFATGGPEQDQDPNYTGEVYRLYLRQEHQVRGLGRALVGTIAQRLAATGLHSLLIWVLAENPACGFYARLGGMLVKEKQWEMEGRPPLKVLAYGWRDISDVLRQTVVTFRPEGSIP